MKERASRRKRKKTEENSVKNGKQELSLEQWLWKCACILRGEVDAPKYKNYILPLIFLKRLSDVFDDELAKLAEEYGDLEIAKEVVETDRELVWFYIPEKARWENIRKQSKNIGEYLTDAVRAVARENPKLQGVIDRVDFNATESGQRILSDENLKRLINELSKRRLGLNDVEPDIIGRAYEYLLRKFAEGSGQSAGEFYTPKEVAVLMARIMDPELGQEIYDPCVGSGGLLIKAQLRFREKYGDDPTIEPLRFYGQEILPDTYAMAKMNVFIHRMEADIRLGNTMTHPAFTNDDGSLRKFDIVLANPMWNQGFNQKVYENDPYGRFEFGYPPSSSADWGWIQHMYASLKDNGRMAVVLDTGAVSRGSGSQNASRERDIREEFVERDLIEAVILLPENLFYNTPAPGVILVINRNKRHPGEILLINASHLFKKGRPKNFLPESAIYEISEIYLKWEEREGLSKIITNEEAAKNDYNLSPSRYVIAKEDEEVLSLEEALGLLKEAEKERAKADNELEKIIFDLYESLALEEIRKTVESDSIRRHANFFESLNRNKEVKEEQVVRIFLENYLPKWVTYDVKHISKCGDNSDPPDVLVFTHNAKICFEVTELVHKNSVEVTENYKRKALSEDKFLEKLGQEGLSREEEKEINRIWDVYVEWTPEMFIDKIKEIIRKKKSKFEDTKESCSKKILLIFTDEPALDYEICKKALEEYKTSLYSISDEIDFFDGIYILLSYDPARKSYPVIRIK